MEDSVEEGTLLWNPPPAVRESANITDYMGWLAMNHGLQFENYRELWQWSVSEVDEFWVSLWEYFGIIASRQPTATLADRPMPGATWFPGARLNYAENFFERANEGQPALLYQAESGPLITLSWSEIRAKTAALARALKKMGVVRGDRVVAFVPNIPEAIIALFACASLGAVWSSCSPDFGSRSVLDRFQQIEPRVLIAVDGYTYNGKPFNRLETVAELQAGLPTLVQTILIPLLEQEPSTVNLKNTLDWGTVMRSDESMEELVFEQVPFEHPLWVLYSSGTTGLPKPIVQGHGGILLEHFKEIVLHLNLKPGDRFFWYTSTGWMMWNFLVAGLLSGCTIVLYNGSPGYPSLDALWKLALETGITYFGTSAAFIHSCMKAGLSPNRAYDLSRIRAVGSTGSPLSAAGFAWVYGNVNQNLAVESVSGGTDLCTAFLGGCPLLPVYAGEIQAAALGANVRAYNASGQPVVDEVGELVITEPMPSMPIYFWNDPEQQRYRASYFEVYPGIWRHGDWIKFNQRGGCVIYGRSDSTINRYGVRMGTSEIYQAVQSLPEIQDCLIIDLEQLGRESYMPLFVVLSEGAVLTEELANRIRRKIRRDISPRHVPDEIFAIPEVPYTLSGKKMEVPIRRILLGQPTEKAANPGAMRNPESLQFFTDLASRLGS